MTRAVLFLSGLFTTALFALAPHLFESWLGVFAPAGAPAIYGQAPLWRLAVSHLLLVSAAVGASTAVGFLLAVGVTRRGGRVFRPLARAFVSGAQCFPPVAVLALLVPVLGFGGTSLVLALFLSGVLPVFENALRALEGVPVEVREAARGMGLTPWGRFWEVEAPLALPFAVLGLRLCWVLSMSTATLGSSVGVSTLGEVVVAGLGSGNASFVAQGAVLVGLLSGLGWVALGWLARRGR